MKSYNHLWEKMVSQENMELAFANYSQGRSKEKIMKLYTEDKHGTIDYFIKYAENYEVYPHRVKEIYDGIVRKKRKIVVPDKYEQVVHHMVIATLKPIFLKPMYVHSYGSMPNKGTLKCKKTVERWIKNDKKNTKYCLQMDIRKYFESIPKQRLKDMLAKITHDKKFLHLVYQCIDVPIIDEGVSENGIPLGFYPSQWFANVYLTGLDHYIKEQLHAVYYARYMDDMVIFGPNKRKLYAIEKAVDAYLHSELGLELKPNWRVKKIGDKDGEDLDFVGYRFYSNRTTLRKGNMYRATRKARAISKKGKATVYDARQMMSRLGWFKHCDTYNSYEQWIKPYISAKQLRKIISENDKRRAKHELANT